MDTSLSLYIYTGLRILYQNTKYKYVNCFLFIKDFHTVIFVSVQNGVRLSKGLFVSEKMTNFNKIDKNKKIKIITA